MTLAHGTDRLESARLMLRRVAPGDLPFFTRIHRAGAREMPTMQVRFSRLAWSRQFPGDSFEACL
jgi:hypothetical protein